VDGAQGVPRGQEETDRERTSAADEGQSAGRLGDERWSRGGGEHGGEDQEAGGAVEQGSCRQDWAIRGGAEEEVNTEERIKRLEELLNKAQTRLARLIAGFKSIEHQLVQRLDRLEELTGCGRLSPSESGRVGDV